MNIDFESYRLICSFLIGMMITNSGSLIQTLTKNELASPSTLGFQAFIVFIILIVNTFYQKMNHLFFLGDIEYWSLAIGGGFILILSLLTAKEKKIKVYKNKSPQGMDKILLIGLGVNLLIGAIFSIWHFIYMALNKEFPSQIWFGHFKYTDGKTLIYVLIFFSLLFLTELKYLKKLQLLALGESFYQSLGESVYVIQRKIILIVAIQTLLVVSLFGVFSFSALIIPLVLRRFHFFAKRLHNEIIYGGICGGFFFLLLDLACYNITLFGAELPVGMLTSTLGAMIMVYLLVKQKCNNE